MNDVSEVWAEFCDGFYEVSSTGNIRRAKPGIATFVGRPVSPVCGPTGYKVIAVGNGTGKQQRKYVHHVVAEAFIGHRPDGHVVNHIDGDKQNNCAANLEYVTRKGNAAHAIAVIPRKKGPTIPASRGAGGSDPSTAPAPANRTSGGETLTGRETGAVKQGPAPVSPITTEQAAIISAAETFMFNATDEDELDQWAKDNAAACKRLGIVAGSAAGKRLREIIEKRRVEIREADLPAGQLEAAE